MTTEKHYLRDVFPDIYQQAKEWLRNEFPETVEELDHLFITGKCCCGSCSDFHLDSDIPELSRASGSTKLLRPLYYDMDNDSPFMIGLSSEIGDDSVEYYHVSSFESNGLIAEINEKLCACGFPLPTVDD